MQISSLRTQRDLTPTPHGTERMENAYQQSRPECHHRETPSPCPYPSVSLCQCSRARPNLPLGVGRRGKARVDSRHQLHSRTESLRQDTVRRGGLPPDAQRTCTRCKRKRNDKPKVDIIRCPRQRPSSSFIRHFCFLRSHRRRALIHLHLAISGYSKGGAQGGHRSMRRRRLGLGMSGRIGVRVIGRSR
jgi:hypothetical protein